MIPEYVYHYTTRATALELILPSRSLRIGSLGITNDPRETKEWGFGYKPIPVPNDGDTDFDCDLSTRIQFSANRIRREEWWALCTSTDDHQLLPEGPDLPDRNHFRYGYARGRLWAQYADNHKGVCLVFDGPLLHAAIHASRGGADIFCGHVTYNDEWEAPAWGQRYHALELDYHQIVRGDACANLREHIRQNCQWLLLEKSKDWETEREFRWLLNGFDGPYVVDISNAIRGVIAGVDFPAVDGPTLFQLCESLSIKTERMRWANRLPIKQRWELSEL